MSERNRLEVSAEIANIINIKIDESQYWPNLPGQAKIYPTIRRILADILEGATLEDLRRHFQTWIPGSLSQVGAWMPREIHEHLGRLLESTYIIKVGGFRKGRTAQYQDLVSWVEKHGEDKLNDDHIMHGMICTCFRCGAIMASKEPAHQFYCPACRAAVQPLKGRRAAGTTATPNLTKTQKVALATAIQVFTLHKQGKSVEKYMGGLNAHRANANLESITIEAIEAAGSPADLLI